MNSVIRRCLIAVLTAVTIGAAVATPAYAYSYISNAAYALSNAKRDCQPGCTKLKLIHAINGAGRCSRWEYTFVRKNAKRGMFEYVNADATLPSCHMGGKTF